MSDVNLEVQSENLPREWKERIKRMSEYQREHGMDWESNERLLVGDPTGVKAEGLKDGTGNQSRGHAYAWGLVRSLLSEIYAQNPQVIAEPFSQSLYQHGRLITRIVQSDMDLMDAEAVLQEAIEDTFPYGYGAVIEAAENIVSTRVGEDGEELPSLDAQNFVLRRIHPNDILFDPHGRNWDLSDHRFLAIRFYPSIKWLREEKQRREAKGEKWTLPEKLDETPESLPEQKGANRLEQTQQQMGFGLHQESDPEYRRVAVLEIHDKVSKKILYVLEHQLFFLGENDWPVKFCIAGKDYFPVTLIAFNRRSTGFYPIPELSLVRPQLLELANLARMMREDAGNKYRKIATIAELIDPSQRAAMADMTMPQNLLTFDKKAVEEFFGYGDDNVPRDFDIRRVVTMLDDIMVNREHPIRYQMVEAEIQAILGYGPANRGGIPKVRSAMEASIISDANEGRLQQKISRVERAFRQICEKHIIFLQQLQVEERYARNFPELARVSPFFAYTKEQIKGDFAFRVYAGSSAPRNTNARRAQVKEMAQVLGPFLIQQGRDIRPLAEVLAKAHGWDEVDMLWNDIRGQLLALAATWFAVQQGQADPQALLEVVARTVQTGLSEAELGALAQKLGGQQGGAPAGMVPAEKPANPRGDTNPAGTAAGVI